MTDVLEQLAEEEESLRVRRAELAARLFEVDEQLERVDAAAAALRGVKRAVTKQLTERTGSLGGRVMHVRASGQVEYAPAEENVEKVLAALREHGEQAQRNLPALTGLHMGTIHRTKKVLLERDLVVETVPKRRPPDQGAGRISPRLRLK